MASLQEKGLKKTRYIYEKYIYIYGKFNRFVLYLFYS